MRGRPLVRPAEARAIGAFVFALAFLLRAYWATRVQRPHDALYSDMAGYVLRADLLLAGEMPGEPRMLALWPWGTHAIVAGEFALFGRTSVIAIGLCHALVGALAAPCASALAARFVGGFGALLAGAAVACWHPHIIFTGFFCSEIWFTSLNMLATVLLVRHSERRGGALLAGLCLAVAFVVRPQVLLTVLLVGFAVAVAVARGRSLSLLPSGPSSRRGAVALLLPLCLAMAISSARYHRLMGHHGLIAAYEPMQRLFGETDVIKLEASWKTAKGEQWTWWFTKTGRGSPSPATTESFEGFIADGDIVTKIRLRRLEGVPLGTRLRRRAENVLYLVARNVPWPESDARPRVRRILQKGYANAVLAVLPLALVGLFALGRQRMAGLLLKAQLATIVSVGALYIGEARYRVPYDPFLLVVAVVGLWTIGQAVLTQVRRRRRTSP